MLGQSTRRNDQELQKVAKVATDILPGECGQVRISGVYWRAKSATNQVIRAGQTVYVLGRESTTLHVSLT